MKSSKDLYYLPAVEGMRGFAASIIVLFHFGLTGLQSGFIGVDIFFVISGYVITLKLLRDISEKGRIDFLAFYTGRIRRLFPSFLVVAAVSAVLSWLLFPEDLLVDMAWSTLAASAHYANIYFFFSADYFDSSSITKPLLHTWSLSVEEQFYILWPFTLMLLARKVQFKYQIGIIVFLILASLLAAEVLRTNYSKDSAFYLFPTRLFELLAGAILAFFSLLPRNYAKQSNLITIVSLAMIIIFLVTFDDSSPLPGFLSLAFIIPTMSLILANQCHLSQAIFSNPVSLFLGRISYPLYLVHWPLVVFWHSGFGRDPSTFDAVFLVFISIVLAYLLHKFVEQKFRYTATKERPTLRPIVVSLATIAISGGSAFLIVKNEGFSFRIPEARQHISVEDQRKQQRTLYCSSNRHSLPADIVTCQNERDMDQDLYVWGDSHAQHLVAGLHDVFVDANIFTLRLSGCDPFAGFDGVDYTSKLDRLCAERNRNALVMFQNLEPTNILLSWSLTKSPDEYSLGIQNLVPQLESLGHKVAVITDFIRPGLDISQCTRVPDYLLSDLRLRKICAPKPSFVKDRIQQNNELRDILEKQGVTVVHAADVQCSELRCEYYDGDELLYRDLHHLNDAGSKLFLQRARNELLKIYK